MNEPESPQYEPHSLVRSRTPAERNAERQAIFDAKQQAKADAQQAKNAEPRAGQGLRKDGNMLTVTGGQGRSGGGNLEVIISSNGYAVYATIEGTITGSVPPEP